MILSWLIIKKMELIFPGFRDHLRVQPDILVAFRFGGGFHTFLRRRSGSALIALL
jgi:hypothetical protein